MTSDRVSNERLAEMLAGLEAVTPGPWRPSTWGFQIVSDYPETASQSVVELRVKPQKHPERSRAEEASSQEAIAYHLARCDPDTMRLIIAELLSSRASSGGVTRGEVVTDEMVDLAHRELMSQLFILCQPDHGDVFAFMDDRKDVMRAVLSAAQHLRSPVTVSDEMVERALKAYFPGSEYDLHKGMPDDVTALVVQHMRDALTSALAPAEQEGKPFEAELKQELAKFDAAMADFRAPTHPGGDSRVVAWRQSYEDDGLKFLFLPDGEIDKEKPSDWEPLATLSSLEAVERQRDHFETEALQFEIVAKGLREKVVAAEASLAAAQTDFEQRILSSLSPPTGGWKDIESAPKDRTPIIIAVPTKDRDGYIVGEAYYDPESYDGEWYWAGTGHGDYHGGPISEINHHMPTHWQPLPSPPEAE